MRRSTYQPQYALYSTVPTELVGIDVRMPHLGTWRVLMESTHFVCILYLMEIRNITYNHKYGFLSNQGRLVNRRVKNGTGYTGACVKCKHTVAFGSFPPVRS